MSDALKRNDAIHAAVTQTVAARVGSHLAGHVATLSELVSGIVGSRHTQLPRIADEAPCRGAQRESQLKRYRRWLAHTGTTYERYYLPFVPGLLRALGQAGELILVLDSSSLGHGCQALMLSVVYQSRALPLAWIVQRGKKGHFKQADHWALLQQVQNHIPPACRVIVLGDGEFDGVDYLAQVAAAGWFFVSRSAHNRWLAHPELGAFRFNQIQLQPDEAYYAHPVAVTQARAGAYCALAYWQHDCAQPLFLLSNLDDPEQAVQLYRLRFRIETLFSDHKSRGFHLHRSHLSDPLKLARLLIPTCLAYLWLVYLGTVALLPAWRTLIHRAKRRDLSLFQLGCALIALWLKRDLPLLVHFVPLPP